jgi:membrane protease YdiL (CAAX protease family)
MEANPYINIQTWRGAESVLARRITSDAELAEAFAFAMSNPSMRMVMKSAGFGQTLEQFLAQKGRFTFVAFDPMDHSAPEPLRSNLVWVWAVSWILVAGTSAILAAYFLNGAFPFSTLLWLIIPLIAVIRTRDSAFIGLRRIPLKDFVIVSIAATLASSAIVLLFEPWSHTGQMLYKLAISSTTPDATFLWLKQFTGLPGVIAMIVYGGSVTLFTEELFFRGWLQLWLLQRLPTVWAILIQATVFTVLVNLLVALFMPPLHAILYLVVYSWLGIGVVNGWAAARTCSIWPGLVAAIAGILLGMLMSSV